MVFTEFEDGAGVLLNLESKFYYSLNETGLFLWKRIDGRSGEERLARMVETSYDVSHPKALENVRRFLRRLASLQLIVRCLVVIGLLAAGAGCGRRMEAPGEKAVRSPVCTHEIAFASNKDGPNSIYRMNEDGTDMERLTNPACPSCVDFYPTWSPTGDTIAYSANQEFFGPRHIMTMKSDGTGVTQLTFGSENTENPDFSCDGKLISYTFEGQIWVMDADGGNPHPLTTLADTPYGAGAARWSPDCTRIAYLSDPSLAHLGGQPPVRPATYSTLWVMDADGGNKRPVLCGGKPILYMFVPMTWSCDGRTILYSAPLGGHQRLLMADTEDCQAPIDVTPAPVNNAGDPAWYPDCGKITFTCEMGDGYMHICSMSLKGTDLSILTPGILYAVLPGNSPPLCRP